MRLIGLINEAHFIIGIKIKAKYFNYPNSKPT